MAAVTYLDMLSVYYTKDIYRNYQDNLAEIRMGSISNANLGFRIGLLQNTNTVNKTNDSDDNGKPFLFGI
jgi:hypothetical protein